MGEIRSRAVGKLQVGMVIARQRRWMEVDALEGYSLGKELTRSGEQCDRQEEKQQGRR
jgi:hypothetical protein